MKVPIIIIGAPRSGTSVLGRILSRHPDLAYSNEPRMIWRYQNDHLSDALQPVHATPEVKRYIRAKFEAYVRDHSRKRLLEKTPSNSLRVGFVREVFPECKIIHIIRNGFDSALSIRDYWNGFTSGLSYSKIDGEESILKQRLREMHPRQFPFYAAEFLARALGSKVGIGQVMWGPRFPGMKQFVREQGVLAVSALQWRLCVEQSCHYGRQIPESAYREVRLEDLTEACIESLFDFCDLEVTPAVKSYYQSHFEKNMSGARRRSASSAELNEIAQWITPTMEWLGYNE